MPSLYIPKNTTELGADRPLLTAQFRQRMFAENKFSALCRVNKTVDGERVGNIGDTANPMPSGSVIEQFKGEFSEHGMDMDVPVLDRLYGDPVSDTTLKGRGESKNYYFRRIKIGALRKAEKVITFVNAQKLGRKLTQQYNDKNKSLVRWRNDWFEFGELYAAMFYGYSHHVLPLRGILGSRTDITPFSHGNMYTANAGRVDYQTAAPGASGGAYETNAVIPALQSLQVGAAGHDISPKLLRTLNRECAVLNIKPPKISNSNGMIVNDLFPMLISDAHYMSLWENEEFRNSMSLLPRGWDNPVFTMAKCVYAGFVIYVDKNMWGVQGTQGAVTADSTYYVPKYGPPTTNLIGQVHNSDFKPLIVLGENAFLQGIGMMPEVKEEIDDYEVNIELGTQEISGVVRNDHIDKEGFDGTSNAWKENQSSLMCWTATKYQTGFGA